MRLETWSNNVKLPHDACLISRVNCKNVSPETVSSVDAEKIFVNIFKFTHSCVTCFTAIICMRARNVLSFAFVIYDPDAFNTLLMLLESDKHRKFVFAGWKFSNFAFMRNRFSPKENLSPLRLRFLWKYFEFPKHTKWIMFQKDLHTEIRIKSDSGIIASAAVSVRHRNFRYDNRSQTNENKYLKNANDYYSAIFCPMSQPVEH